MLNVIGTAILFAWIPAAPAIDAAAPGAGLIWLTLAPFLSVAVFAAAESRAA